MIKVMEHLSVLAGTIILQFGSLNQISFHLLEIEVRS